MTLRLRLKASPPLPLSRRLLLPLFLALALAGAVTPAAVVAEADPVVAGADPAPAGAIPGELLVTYADAVPATTRSGLANAVLGVRSRRPLARRVELVAVSPERADAATALLAAQPGVLAVEPNVQREFAGVPDDPLVAQQWAHEQTNLLEAWATATGGGTEGETRPLVAVIDSGIDATHPELAGVVVSSLRAGDGEVLQGVATNDECGIGHGTLVAGVVGARANNASGVAGVLWNPRIIDISVTSPLNGCPSGPPDDDAITAMTHLAELDEPPLVMNLSFGTNSTQCSAAYQAVIEQVRAAGIVVVSSAGNAGNNGMSVPASCDGAMSIAASNKAAGRATYSQFNPHVDLAAPGGQVPNCDLPLSDLAVQGILTTTQFETGESKACRSDQGDPNLEAVAGTSFAAPYVAAVVALIRQHAIDAGLGPLDPDQIESVLEHTAIDTGPEGRDQDHGWGIVDVAAALTMVIDGTIPPLEPDPPFPVAGAKPTAVRYVDPVDPDVTDPIRQAVAVSASLPDGSAPAAVLARSDDFADALAGSALGGGVAPLLYTPSNAPLDPVTAEELRRVLAFGDPSPVVYVLGGPSAVPSSVDDELTAMGAAVIRVAGEGREATAAAVSQLLEDLEVHTASGQNRDFVFVTNGRDFADAVTAGQMAAYYGIPVLVTNAEGLHPITAEEISRRQPERVLVVGGTSAISEAALTEIEAFGIPTERLFGSERVGTALAVFDRFKTELGVDDNGTLENAATIAVNLRSNFNDVLSATLLAGQGNVFFPLDGEDGSHITPDTRQVFCGFAGELLVVGGYDRVSDDTVADILDILAQRSC